GQTLADAIQADHLPWDPSVQALLPFPSVLEMMANDMSWTTDLGNAFLSQQQDVMDAVAESAGRPGITDICAATPRSSSAMGRSSALWKSHEPDGSPLTIEDIIGATGDSPLTYLQKLRIAAAKRLLESDHRSMQEISDAVGYQDVVFFRQLF